jgi:hypothetical protein
MGAAEASIRRNSTTLRVHCGGSRIGDMRFVYLKSPAMNTRIALEPLLRT